MSITLRQFVESVTTPGLMDSDDIQSLLDTLPLDHRLQTAEDLAKELCRQGKLTRFHARQTVYQK